MSEMLRFIIIGALNSLFGYSLIFAFMYLADFSPEISNFIVYFIGSIVSYMLHRRFSFYSTNEVKREFPKFLLVLILSFGVNFIVLFILLNYFYINPFLCQIISGCFYIVFSYLLNKLIVFRKLSIVPR